VKHFETSSNEFQTQASVLLLLILEFGILTNRWAKVFNWCIFVLRRWMMLQIMRMDEETCAITFLNKLKIFGW